MTVICPCCGEEICDEFNRCPVCRFDIELYDKEVSVDVKVSMLENGKNRFAKDKETREEREALRKLKEADEVLHPERKGKLFCRIGLLLLGAFVVVAKMTLSRVLKHEVLPVAFFVGMVGVFLWCQGVSILGKMVNRVSTLKRVGIDFKCPKCGMCVESWDKETLIHVWLFKFVVEGSRSVTYVAFAVALIWLLDIMLELPLAISWFARALYLVAPAMLIWQAFFARDRIHISNTCPKCGNKSLVSLAQRDLEEVKKGSVAQ